MCSMLLIGPLQECYWVLFIILLKIETLGGTIRELFLNLKDSYALAFSVARFFNSCKKSYYPEIPFASSKTKISLINP